MPTIRNPPHHLPNLFYPGNAWQPFNSSSMTNVAIGVAAIASCILISSSTSRAHLATSLAITAKVLAGIVKAVFAKPIIITAAVIGALALYRFYTFLREQQSDPSYQVHKEIFIRDLTSLFVHPLTTLRALTQNGLD